MSDGTKIEWTDATVNAVNGCSVLSPGCTNCYAMKLAGTRLRHHESRAGLTIDTKAGPVWNGTTKFNERALLQPLAWKRPRRIFWNAHGDLFHESVPDEWIDKCFAVMALTPQHSHQVLTKRSARMREYMSGEGLDGGRAMQVAIELFGPLIDEESGLDENKVWDMQERAREKLPPLSSRWPLPNVWLGVSVEDQQRADERIPDLLATPAAVRFLSCEPLLGPVDLTAIKHPDRAGWLSPLTGDHQLQPVHADHHGARIDWVIAGGESGPKARPMHPDWARGLRDQCAAAGVAFHFKQWGEWKPLDENGSGFWPSDEGGFIRLTAAGERNQNGWPMQRVGKKAAGRLLDDVQHDGMPA